MILNTITYKLAFSRAMEAATETEILAGARWLQALMEANGYV